jgi:hypothetical protein
VCSVAVESVRLFGGTKAEQIAKTYDAGCEIDNAQGGAGQTGRQARRYSGGAGRCRELAHG